tara:strand:- start:734 stop:2671 length:1938 start_codon:yes stop_codon:yes gene_type:complete
MPRKPFAAGSPPFKTGCYENRSAAEQTGIECLHQFQLAAAHEAGMGPQISAASFNAVRKLGIGPRGFPKDNRMILRWKGVQKIGSRASRGMIEVSRAALFASLTFVFGSAKMAELDLTGGRAPGSTKSLAQIVKKMRKARLNLTTTDKKKLDAVAGITLPELLQMVARHDEEGAAAKRTAGSGYKMAEAVSAVNARATVGLSTRQYKQSTATILSANGASALGGRILSDRTSRRFRDTNMEYAQRQEADAMRKFRKQQNADGLRVGFCIASDGGTGKSVGHNTCIGVVQVTTAGGLQDPTQESSRRKSHQATKAKRRLAASEKENTPTVPAAFVLFQEDAKTRAGRDPREGIAGRSRHASQLWHSMSDTDKSVWRTKRDAMIVQATAAAAAVANEERASKRRRRNVEVATYDRNTAYEEFVSAPPRTSAAAASSSSASASQHSNAAAVPNWASVNLRFDLKYPGATQLDKHAALYDVFSSTDAGLRAADEPWSLFARNLRSPRVENHPRGAIGDSTYAYGMAWRRNFGGGLSFSQFEPLPTTADASLPPPPSVGGSGARSDREERRQRRASGSTAHPVVDPPNPHALSNPRSSSMWGSTQSAAITSCRYHHDGCSCHRVRETREMVRSPQKLFPTAKTRGKGKGK